MSKYEPLSRYLANREAAVVRLSFDEVEAILGTKLPPSAYNHPEWWSNNTEGHSHARAWVDIGWRTGQVDKKNRTLVFRRCDKPAQAGAPPIFGRMRGTIVFRPDVDLTEPTDEVWNAECGILHE